MDGGCVENCDDSTSLEVYACLDIWLPLSTLITIGFIPIDPHMILLAIPGKNTPIWMQVDLPQK